MWSTHVEKKKHMKTIITSRKILKEPMEDEKFILFGSKIFSGLHQQASTKKSS